MEMWLARNSQSISMSFMSPFFLWHLAPSTDSPFPCSLSPSLCGAVSKPLRMLFPPPGMFFSLLCVHPSPVCVSQSVKALSCKQKSLFCLSWAKRERISGALVLMRGQKTGHGKWDRNQGSPEDPGPHHRNHLVCTPPTQLWPLWSPSGPVFGH